jgi:hypothetical protein
LIPFVYQLAKIKVWKFQAFILLIPQHLKNRKFAKSALQLSQNSKDNTIAEYVLMPFVVIVQFHKSISKGI